MIKREWRQLLEMIKFSLGKGKAPELRVETDWGKFYRICKFHKIQSMVCPGIQKLPKEQQPPEEILKKFQEAESMEIARDAVQAFSQEELLEAFEKEGISVLPLKGILMKRFYPVTSMRMMADLDILYETGRGKEVEAVLTDLGYYCDHRDSHHDVFFRKPFMNIEMHHCMIGENSLLDAYYEDIWKRARQEEGKSHIYRLSWEDFYIFMIAHMAKHFQGGGCGIRSIVDMWLFSDRMKESLDWDYAVSYTHLLKEYSQFMEVVQNYQISGEEEPYKKAIKECIERGILADYLMRKGSEVVNMLLDEYDYETDIEVQREEAREEGRKLGREEGRMQGREEGREEERKEFLQKICSLIQKKLEKGKTVSEIANDLEDTEENISHLIKQFHLN